MAKKKAVKAGKSSKAKKQRVVYSRSFKAGEVDLTEFREVARKLGEKLSTSKKRGVVLEYCPCCGNLLSLVYCRYCGYHRPLFKAA